MNQLIPFIKAAGVVQLVIAAANFVIPRKLAYAESLARVTPIVRQVFIVHAVYIVGMLVAFGGLCWGFAPELAGGSGLGCWTSGFLAVFWGARVFVQAFYYDAELKRQNRAAHVFFLSAFVYLALVFTAAALGGRP